MNQEQIEVWQNERIGKVVSFYDRLIANSVVNFDLKLENSGWVATVTEDNNPVVRARGIDRDSQIFIAADYQKHRWSVELGKLTLVDFKHYLEG